MSEYNISLSPDIVIGPKQGGGMKAVLHNHRKTN